jgi:hypothetical protein
MKVLFDYRERKKYSDFPEELPDELFNEDWAYKIHSQTLKRLNERGGLSPQEMIVNIRKLSFRIFCREFTIEMAINILTEILELNKRGEYTPQTSINALTPEILKLN